MIVKLNTLRNVVSNIRYILFLLAPLLFFYLIFFVDIDPENPLITYTLAVSILMAIWWMTEVIPLAVTSLLPIVLFPLLGIMNGKEVSILYFNHVIFLFIGGFLVALAIQKWGLHKRIALNILRIIGSKPQQILLGFMFATAFLSMWISNTATVMLMLPILLSIIAKLKLINEGNNIRLFIIGLLLSIAYSASIGGIATLIGTPPNLSFSRIFDIYFPYAPEISFTKWFFYAIPISVIMFIVLFVYFNKIFVKKCKNIKSIHKSLLIDELRLLGKKSFEEKVLLVAFTLLAALWFFRSDITLGSFVIPGWSNIFDKPHYFNDGTVAIFIACLLFLIPSKSTRGKFLMDWKTAENIPWHIILLFGGGFALASGFKESGLSTWFGQQLVSLKDVHPLFIILCITFLVTFLTEITSNTATVETLLPILIGLAVNINVNPLLFMLPATVAGSLAFMLPVATPPNAIVFGSKQITVGDMARAGFIINLIGIVVVSLITYFFGTYVFGIMLDVFPDWAK